MLRQRRAGSRWRRGLPRSTGTSMYWLTTRALRVWGPSKISASRTLIARGPFLGCRLLLPLMKARVASIINIASVSSFKPQAELVAYNAAKAGVALMTQSIALHCAQQGYDVRANYINPGVIRTDMLEKVINQVENGEALMQSYRDMHPIGRIGEADEIAAMAVYLASEEAGFITGTGFTVDGGLGINP